MNDALTLVIDIGKSHAKLLFIDDASLLPAAGLRAPDAASASLGGFTSVNQSVSPDAYRDPLARSAADELASAKLIRFSAGDTMPASVQQTWWKAMLELVDDPSKLDSILESLTSAESAGCGPTRTRSPSVGSSAIASTRPPYRP